MSETVADQAAPAAPQTAETAEMPSEKIKKAALKQVTVTDSRSRSITVRRLSPLHKMQLAKLVGSNSESPQYMEYAITAFSITDIAGTPIGPTNTMQLEAVIGELGDEGLEAVGEAVLQLYGDVAGIEEIIASAKK